MITCFLRYTIDPDKLAEFEHYARVRMRLIEKYGDAEGVKCNSQGKRPWDQFKKKITAL